MRHVRLLAFGLAALAAVTAAGCCHTCGESPPPVRSGYYSPCGTPAPCCGSPGPAPAVPGTLPPGGYPASGPAPAYPNVIR
jgi:hypothetical protein